MLTIGLLVVFVTLTLVAQVRGDARCRAHVEHWAERNDLVVGYITRRWFFLGPYWWRTSRLQRVYDVSVVDSTGIQRSAIVRVGGWMLGALDDQVDAKWR